MEAIVCLFNTEILCSWTICIRYIYVWSYVDQTQGSQSSWNFRHLV